MVDGIKQLNIYFSLVEYNKLLKIKKNKKLSWHDLILLLAEPDVERVIGAINATKDKP